MAKKGEITAKSLQSNFDERTKCRFVCTDAKDEIITILIFNLKID